MVMDYKTLEKEAVYQEDYKAAAHYRDLQRDLERDESKEERVIEVANGKFVKDPYGDKYAFVPDNDYDDDTCDCCGGPMD